VDWQCHTTLLEPGLAHIDRVDGRCEGSFELPEVPLTTRFSASPCDADSDLFALLEGGLILGCH